MSREHDFSRTPISRLQLFLYVQASEFVSLPDRSYRCKFPCRAAETFTSEQNVHRCLCTHRICYPPDYRQLAERGLSPRKIHSIVDCSSHYGVYPNQVTNWKRQAMEGVPGLFVDRRSRPDTSEEALKAELYQQIGQLQVELDWLKKKSGLSR